MILLESNRLGHCCRVLVGQDQLITDRKRMAIGPVNSIKAIRDRDLKALVSIACIKHKVEN